MPSGRRPNKSPYERIVAHVARRTGQPRREWEWRCVHPNVQRVNRLLYRILHMNPDKAKTQDVSAIEAARAERRRQSRERYRQKHLRNAGKC